MVNIKQYGGALFSANCPKCGKGVKTPTSLSVNQFMSQCVQNKPHTIKAQCKCGEIKLPFIGWEN